MPVMITRAQRDAIYQMVITHLTGIGDVWLSVKRRDFADAKEMGRKFAEDLRLHLTAARALRALGVVVFNEMHRERLACAAAILGRLED